MELSGETLEAIGRYVRGNLGAWMREVDLDRDIELRERTVRVEEELKAQRELMREGFAQTEKRFEQMEKRFDLMQEQMDRRFEEVGKRFELMQEQMDRRFDEVDKRFEQVDRRFEDMRSYSTRWFTVISLLLTVVGVAVTVSSFV